MHDLFCFLDFILNTALFFDFPSSGSSITSPSPSKQSKTKKHTPTSPPDMSEMIENYYTKKNKRKKRPEPLYEDDELNSHLLNNFQKVSKSKSSNAVTPSTQNIGDDKTKYTLSGKHLFTTKKTQEGAFKLIPSKNFTGTLIVHRKDKNGKLIKNQADIIVFKNGKPVKISTPKTGKSMVANLEGLKKEANAINILPHHQTEIKRTQSISAPSTPSINSPQHKQRNM